LAERATAFTPRLSTVADSLTPNFPLQSVVGEPFDVFGQPVRIERLDGLQDTGVKGATPRLEEAAVRYFMGKGVLEAVCQLGKEACLVEELGSLQMGEAQAERRPRCLGHGLEERQGHLGADDGGGLEQLLLLRRQPVDAGGQHRLHRGWHLNTRQALGQAISPMTADQHLRFHQAPDTLLQKKGVTLGQRDQALLERL
jgi:hypothetical protein